ncbi:esterase, PHB depolymerase family [Lentzea fradiae]|uniref:Esterase, PHB depolymerase family n=1 Tax=Lentzea fradiae TaxID=200378 RepID=A0A1G7KW61_9PSEU|nr:PHB depolymerase family esterase [Lentzea fradiae]SDF41463.1 esterase, PHB depolymerase family [Lentzea fradiae]
MTARRTTFLALLGSALLTAAGAVITPAASAASLTEVTNFGDNPGGMRMHVYVPDTRPANPAVVVAMHGCGGNGPGFHSGSEFSSLADRYGYVVIYPSAQQEAGFGKCFDTWSEASKRRGGGSDPVSIVSMVNYVKQRYNTDPNRVFATGSSSGGMMTQHMLAVYPDVFKAGASFMGVPFNCFANAADYAPGRSQCTGGSMNRTPQQWGDAVRQVNPGFSGTRPKIQLWHGTADNLVPYSLLQESMEQWTNVFGLSQTPTSTDSPRAGWNRGKYSDKVETYSIQGAGHSLPSGGMAAVALDFFGITGTPDPDPDPDPDPEPTPGACSVRAVVNPWNNGLTESVTITNTGTTPVNGWSLTFTLPSGQTIGSGWNATFSPSSGQVTARNVGHNATISPSRSVEFGFQATHNGNTAAASAFALNGATCSTG